MKNKVDNRKVAIKDFFDYELLDIRCSKCESIANLLKLRDGRDTIICIDCSELTLEETREESHFFSDKFKKK